MLVLSLKVGDRVRIGDSLVTVLERRGKGGMKVGVDASPDVAVRLEKRPADVPPAERATA